jgi:cytochrome c
MKRILIAVAIAAVSAGAANAQDAEAGLKKFKQQCFTCHSVGPGAKNKVGPELNGLDGRHSGSVAGYSYSDANKNSGITWNETTFLEYIKDPKAKIPNTKMVFVGLKNEEDAKNVWAYLSKFDAEGKTK